MGTLCVQRHRFASIVYATPGLQAPELGLKVTPITIATSSDCPLSGVSFIARMRPLARLLPVRPGLALERLVYRSQTTEAYRGAADLAQIYKVASRSNRANRVTGALAISGQTFIQVIEGPAARLDELMVRLGRDSRHSDLDILGRWSVSARLFGAWTMAPACLANASPEVHSRFRSDGLGLELVGLLFDAADAGHPVPY